MPDDPGLRGDGRRVGGGVESAGVPGPSDRVAAQLGVDPVKPITLLSVAGLGEPDLLVEVEATAVLP